MVVLPHVRTRAPASWHVASLPGSHVFSSLKQHRSSARSSSSSRRSSGRRSSSRKNGNSDLPVRPLVVHFSLHPPGTMPSLTPSSDQLRSEFVRILHSRRGSEVPFTVEHGKPVFDPVHQAPFTLSNLEAMKSCPRNDIKSELREENLYLITEEGDQGQLPVLILSMQNAEPKRRPAIVFLHSSYKCKEWLRPLLEAYASRGYISVAVDSRYHGERASSSTAYTDALVSSWKHGNTMPFIFDTVWDLIKLADYLTEREDIDPSKIGITGESLGGMHAWFAAFADFRYAVVAPVIGVQGFGWAIENDQWKGRADSIKPLFEAARIDLGKDAMDKKVVETVWNKIAPGLASQFDAGITIPAIAPRPLLIVNGAEDHRCPVAGLDVPVSQASEAYKNSGCPENFKFIAEPGIGHQMTPSMVKAVSDWFDRFLK